MKERAYTFGTDNCLVGVLTEPDADALRGDAPAVLVSNVGMNHRVGPFRLYVDLSRRLAAEGFRVLRFDLSGQGDSAQRRDSRSDLERAVLDTQEAMDFLARKKGVRSFVLMGLCSGTDSVHSVALRDERVTGAVFIDGYSYRTLQFHLRFKLRYLRARRWKRFARKLVAGGRPPAREAPEVYVREYPTAKQMGADLSQMLARKLRLLFIYTGSQGLEYNYENQFHDMLAPVNLRGKVELEFQPSADHLFSLLRDRSWLLDRLSTFMQRSTAASQSAQSSAP